ncbi:MAG: trehalose-phosphatase [Actinomycetota bacterium]|nr:trehalose-phosphatase [Actinomycetota bacterium]
MAGDDPDSSLWAAFLEDPERAAIVTDFDGTLAPIVDDPSQSAPLPEAVEVLHRLSHRYGRVAVVSGRPAAFIAEHLRLGECEEAGGCKGLVVSGLYGIEKAQGDEITPHPDAEEWRRVVDEVAAQAQDEAPEGVTVEHKGLSLTLHYRTAPDQEDWVREWAEEHARSSGLAPHPARMSHELRPPMETDKGSALTELVTGFGAACFAGDDRGDIPAFEALDSLAEGEGMTVLKVAVRSDESPSELLEQGDVEVDGPEGVVELFKRLL